MAKLIALSACALGIVALQGFAQAAPEHGSAVAQPGASGAPLPDVAADKATDQLIDQVIANAIAYLRSKQDPESGGWNHNPSGPNLPAVTGLVLTGMLMDPAIDGRDPAVAKAASYLLSYRQADGGIYDRILPSYNTAICVSALARLGDGAARSGEARASVEAAVEFLKGLQFSEVAQIAGEAGVTTLRVEREHPFYGGIGYGGSGRPDNSNLHFMLTALEDAGVPGDDPAVQRAIVFLQRTQMLGDVNEMEYAEGSTQGGFIYSTSPDAERLGEGESKAGLIEETLSDGTVASRLRSYGSMTYAGFKSYAYANLAPDDPRVIAAMGWIQRNYTLEENPGIGLEGAYYYYLTFAKALAALGEPALETITESKGKVALDTADGRCTIVLEAGRRIGGRLDIDPDEDFGFLPGGVTDDGRWFTVDEQRGIVALHEPRDWRDDLVTRLAGLQREDGSLRSLDNRWMEGDPVLITAYALIALQHARMAGSPESPE